MPYRLAVRIAPLVAASYNKTSLDASGSMSGGCIPPKVSYIATLSVFNAATGKLLREIPAHEERTAACKADVTDCIRAEVRTFIAGIDPAYRLTEVGRLAFGSRRQRCPDLGRPPRDLRQT